MPLFQWQRIDPTPAEVEAALQQARRAAGGRRPAPREIRDAAASGLGAGSVLVRRSLRGSARKTRQYAYASWPDHAGRKHWFVEGDEYSPHGDPHPLWRFRDAIAHPLCVIDPLHAVVRGQGEAAAVLLVCDCGEVGTPEALGWSGDCCGPCFDRRAEGAGVAERLAVHAHHCSVRGVAFAEDGCVLSVGRDGALYRFDPSRGAGTQIIPPGDRGGAGIAALPGNRAAVAFVRAEVVCWDLETLEECWSARCAGEVMGLTASPDGDWLAVDMVDVPYLLDAWAGEHWRAPRESSNFAFGPNNTLFAYESDYRGVICLDLETGEVNETGLEFGEPEEDDCYGLACSPTGALLASGGNDGRVRLGDPAAGRWIHLLERPALLVSELAFTPEGDVLASGHDGAVFFWDLRAGHERGSLALPIGESICSLAFSTDGEMLAVGDDHGVVRLWPWRRLLSTGN